jgi:hypothetical protein
VDRSAVSHGAAPETGCRGFGQPVSRLAGGGFWGNFWGTMAGEATSDDRGSDDRGSDERRQGERR